jgi:hypothetical protein
MPRRYYSGISSLNLYYPDWVVFTLGIDTEDTLIWNYN